MPATPPLWASAESLLNRSMAASSPAMALARRLEGTSLQIDVRGIVSIRASISGGRLALQRGDPAAPADATIAGPLSALLQLLQSGGQGAPVARAERYPSAQIRGDAEIANLYREFFAAAAPDPEEELSRLIGDLPARRLSQFAQRTFSWLDRARRTAAQNLAEYLQEESRDLIAKPELERFLQEVDELRDATERALARLKILERRLATRDMRPA
jgi:ubiquinone biosynthesis protein UbiJ